MDLEQALQEIEKLRGDLETVNALKDDLLNEKQTLLEKTTLHTKELEKSNNEIERLKQANMRYFEKINFESPLTEQKPKQETVEEKTISIDDLANAIII